MLGDMDANDLMTMLVFLLYAGVIGGLAIRHGRKLDAKKD